MIDRLDIDRGDIVGEKHDFVRVYLVLVFVEEVFRLDEARLQEPRDERSRSGETPWRSKVM